MSRPLVTVEANIDRPGITAPCSPTPTVYPLSVGVHVEFALGDHADALEALDRAHRDAVEQIHQASTGAGGTDGSMPDVR